MIALACDHKGYELKLAVIKYLDERGLKYKDFGCHGTESCDYPDFAEAAGRSVASGECERGMVFCSTGIGVSIAANKVKGIRCALCGDTFSAEMTRRHNNTNMLAVGAGITGGDLALKIVEVWLNTEFEGGRHERRVNKIMEIENR